MDILRRNLRLGRLSKNLSQKELGDMLGVSNRFIHRIEKNPSKLKLHDLIDICNILDLNINYVLTTDLFNVGVNI